MKNKLDNEQYFIAIESIVMIYGPVGIKEIKTYIKKYFKNLEDDIDDAEYKKFLDMLVEDDYLFKKRDKYSFLPFETIKQIEKEGIKENIEKLRNNPKEFASGEDLTRWLNPLNLMGIKEFDELDDYLSSLKLKKNHDYEETLKEIVSILYYFENPVPCLNLMEESFKNFDENKVTRLFDNFCLMMPRPYLGGHSIKEELMLDEDYSEEELPFDDSGFNDLCNSIKDFLSDKHKISTYPEKKDYPSFSYEDCLALAKKLEQAEIFKLIDSDRVLELTINKEKVYVQVLGFYRKDKNIIIYPTREDMLRGLSCLLANEDEYPDMPYHISNIEVCLADSKGFVTEEIENELRHNHLPLVPSFVRLTPNLVLRLINKKEMDIVGGVLSDLLKLVQVCNLSDITLNLGQKKEMDFDINQVYVLDDEVLFGAYNDIEIGDVILNFKPEPFERKKLNKLKKCQNEVENLVICTYIMQTLVEDGMPIVVFGIDNDTGIIRFMDVFHLANAHKMKNDILERMIEFDVKPVNVGFNNDYSREIFDEFLNYYEELEEVDLKACNEAYYHLDELIDDFDDDKNYS